MSQENVEIVAHMYDAFGRAGPEGMFEFMEPDINYRAIEGAPDDIGVFTGLDAQRRYLGEWVEMFDDLGVETDALVDAGDRVVVHLHVTARVKGTDAPVDMRLGLVWTLRDGKVVKGREYATYEEADRVAGLRE